MSPVKTASRWPDRPSLRMPRPARLLALASLALALPLALSAWLMPPALVLPAFALSAFVLSLTLTVTTRLLSASAVSRPTSPTLRDVAGAFALVGAAAAIFADLDHAARWLGP
ncbi:MULTISPECIES: hypothetical protein [Rhodoplanes]|jgi:hypothetical protein|uniref:Uncharacterized protein n=1 Tax=Rhodoplanes serenus TaxID=200615 RepID=A0A447CZC7_9BRAD|nr:hypothetical protein [Rhodoplanes serenus]VCU10598.1 hypothetical protein RHODGE_RHODGE_03799 [Rhodoplanes serenus]